MKKIIIIWAVAALIATIAFLSSFYGNVTINGINCKGLNNKELSQAYEKYNTVTFLWEGKKTKLKLPIKYKAGNRLEMLLSHFKPIKNQSVSITLDYAFNEFKQYNRDSENASINYQDFTINKEVNGIDFNAKDLKKRFIEAKEKDITLKEFKIDTSWFEYKPKVTEDKLYDKVEYLKEYITNGVTVNFDNASISISQEELAKAVKDTLNQKKVEKLLKGKTIRPYTAIIKTRNGEKKLPNYALDFSVDAEKTAESIVNGINNKEHSVNGYYNSKPFDSSRVEVNLAKQTVKFVTDDKIKLESSCVTGTQGHRTPIGIYRISYKARNVTLRGRNDDGSKYASPVSYWMPFNGGIGLHDASWRGAFGGSIYVSNGSHGCINMPSQKAGELYGMVESGTLVIVY